MVTIAQISDPHVGFPYHLPELPNRGLVELDELQPRTSPRGASGTGQQYHRDFDDLPGRAG